MTSMALTSAADIRLCRSKGHECFLHKFWHWDCQREILGGGGELRDCSFFLLAVASILQTFSRKMERGLPCPASSPGCPKKVSCLLKYSLVCRSQTPLLPVTDMTGRKQICRPLNVSWNWINTKNKPNQKNPKTKQYVPCALNLARHNFNLCLNWRLWIILILFHYQIW